MQTPDQKLQDQVVVLAQANPDAWARFLEVFKEYNSWRAMSLVDYADNITLQRAQGVAMEAKYITRLLVNAAKDIEERNLKGARR